MGQYSSTAPYDRQPASLPPSQISQPIVNPNEYLIIPVSEKSELASKYKLPGLTLRYVVRLPESVIGDELLLAGFSRNLRIAAIAIQKNFHLELRMLGGYPCYLIYKRESSLDMSRKVRANAHHILPSSLIRSTRIQFHQGSAEQSELVEDTYMDLFNLIFYGNFDVSENNVSKQLFQTLIREQDDQAYHSFPFLCIIASDSHDNQTSFSRLFSVSSSQRRQALRQAIIVLTQLENGRDVLQRVNAEYIQLATEITIFMSTFLKNLAFVLQYNKCPEKVPGSVPANLAAELQGGIVLAHSLEEDIIGLFSPLSGGDHSRLVAQGIAAAALATLKIEWQSIVAEVFQLNSGMIARINEINLWRRSMAARIPDTEMDQIADLLIDDGSAEI